MALLLGLVGVSVMRLFSIGFAALGAGEAVAPVAALAGWEAVRPCELPPLPVRRITATITPARIAPSSSAPPTRELGIGGRVEKAAPLPVRSAAGARLPPSTAAACGE